MEKLSYLVTGGAGFIGSNFVELLIAEDHRVTVLDLLTYAGHRVNLPELSKSDSIELVVGDICNTRLVGDLLRMREIDRVVNFAAESHVDRSITGPSAFVQTNVVGTLSLLNASYQYWKHLPKSRSASFRYLQVSTDEVFGSLGPSGKFSETTPMRPNSPYSASKAGADHLVRAWYHTYGLPTLTTNCSNNYGPRQYPEKLIPLMVTRGLGGKSLPVYGTGTNIRDWIHVRDHCLGIILALDRGNPGSSYCFGGDSERDNLEVVQAICRELDQLKPLSDGKKHATHIEFVADRPGHDLRYAIDDSLAQKELGFKRMFKFEEGLAETIRWYHANQYWCKTVIPSEKKDFK